jgi:beta-fructofuranosidase
MGLFYKPADAWAGDFIPFYWKGEYHLFYLKDYRDREKSRGIPWFHISTRNFIEFEDHGEAIPHGGDDEQDLNIFTGCVFHHGERFHIFYTGHNNDRTPKQVVMHATSEDLAEWEKDPGFLLRADEGLYEVDDWRDPFVFWNPEAEEFWMLIAARVREGPESRRGCLALAASSDLVHWDVRPPFWSPGLYYTHECPDLFRWGDWWYLVYSTFTERFVTHYRMSRNLDGPWVAGRRDTFDGRAFYAAKTASDGGRRFAFGWNPTREGDSDGGAWQWGGNLVVHEIHQRRDGELRTALPPELRRPFTRRKELAFKAVLGTWVERSGLYAASAPDGFAWTMVAELPTICKVKARLSWAPGTRGCGLFLRADPGLASYYQLRIEPDSARLVLDRWPRSGDKPFEFERPLEGDGKSSSLEVLLEGSIMEAYFGESVALSSRVYDHPCGWLGLFVSEGSAEFSEVEISSLG